LPGGQVDKGENFSNAAVREVWEETGINTEFLGVIGLREVSEGFRYEQGDVHFTCVMRLKDECDTEINKCDDELNACEWIPLKDLRECDLHFNSEKVIKENILKVLSDDGEWLGPK
jgi:8-oxo-dGTP pyrophosphatase MutT (NUDIX family)